ncbi:peptidylprolyl isomerase [bacterium]|nr:peptidylprolyl isomerase [bacterium]
MNRILIFLCAIAVFGSCEKQRVKKENESIEEYLDEKGLSAEKTEEGVYFIIDEVGTGDNPLASDDVTVDYEGYTLDEKVFDSSYERGKPATFNLQNVIEGWQIGIPLFREGGSGTLIIPSELAYGTNPPPGSGIEKNEVLVFDIELHQIIR